MEMTPNMLKWNMQQDQEGEDMAPLPDTADLHDRIKKLVDIVNYPLESDNLLTMEVPNDSSGRRSPNFQFWEGPTYLLRNDNTGRVAAGLQCLS